MRAALLPRPAQAPAAPIPAVRDGDPDLTIFQTPWWLDAVADRRWAATVAHDRAGGFAWLPYVETSYWGMTLLGMPALTHTLGPVIRVASGRPGAEAAQRRKLIEAVLAKLPRHEGFTQVLDPEARTPIDFLLNGFEVSVRYTYRLDPSVGLQGIWDGFSQKARAKVRRAEAAVVLGEPLTVMRFYEFYQRNLLLRGFVNHHDRDVYERLSLALHGRSRHRIITAYDRGTGFPAASVLLVWDRRALYYLRTTRDPTHPVNGVSSLLVWEAIKAACDLGLVFDSDAFLGRGGARFIESFGIQPRPRLAVSRRTLRLKAAEALGRRARTLWQDHGRA